MIRLDANDVPGNPGYEEEARRRALEELARPISLDAPGSEGEAGQAIGDAARGQGMPQTWAGSRATAGLRDADFQPPGEGGATDMPAATTPIASTQGPARPAQASNAREELSAPFRPTIRQTAGKVPGQVSAPNALEAELGAARDARARRMIANTLAGLVEAGGSLAAGVPVRAGAPLLAGPQEDEARIRRDHRLAQQAKERDARETELTQAREQREATLADRAMSLRERLADIAAQDAGRETTPSMYQAAQAERIRAELADREARRDPFSPQSRAAQEQFRGVVDALPARERARIGETFTTDRVRGMSADELQAPTSMLQRITPRVTSGGGGGGGGTARAQTRRAIVAGLVQRGMSDEQAQAAVAAMGDSRAAAALTSDSLARGRATEAPADNLLPGVRSQIDLEPGEARATRERLMTYRDGYRALADIDRVIHQHGASTIANPAVLAEIEPSLVSLRSMVATIQGTGIINPGERPLIDQTLPDPSSLSGWTLGRIRGSFAGWRQRLDGAASSLLESRAVGRDGVQAGLRFLRSGSTAEGGGASGQSPADVARVSMIDPNGRRMWVRADQREAALSRGWRSAP